MSGSPESVQFRNKRDAIGQLLSAVHGGLIILVEQTTDDRAVSDLLSGLARLVDLAGDNLDKLEAETSWWRAGRHGGTVLPALTAKHSGLEVNG